MSNSYDEYVGWANMLDSAGQDSTEARFRVKDEVVIAQMKSMMRQVIEVGEIADVLKKWVFYGKKSRTYIASRPLTMGQVIEAYDRFDNHETMRLFHCIVGLVTESAEMMEMFMKHIFEGQPIDRQNFIEECGDQAWYLALAARWCNFPTLTPFLDSNRAKLTARYGTKWTQNAAINRDTVNEMLMLDEALPIKCATFEDPASIPQEIRDKMKADRKAAEAEADLDDQQTSIG